MQTQGMTDALNISKTYKQTPFADFLSTCTSQYQSCRILAVTANHGLASQEVSSQQKSRQRKWHCEAEGKG